MLAENDPKKWNEIESISIQALEKRILLWDAINEQIQDKSWSNERTKKNETYSLSFDK